MTILVYLRMDMTARVEKTSLDGFLVEEPDGWHPRSADGIWHNSKRRHDDVVYIAEGVTPAIGATTSHNDIANLLNGHIVTMFAMKRERVSKMWARRVAAFVNFVLVSGIPLLFIGIVAYLLISSLVRGGF